MYPLSMSLPNGCGFAVANSEHEHKELTSRGYEPAFAGPPGVSTPSDLRPQEGAGNEDIDFLRAALAAKGVKVDKRWGIEKLKGLL